MAVNEHPLVDGRIGNADGYLEHHDSPDLDHWVTKQNRYTTAEAASQFEGRALALPPRLFGSALERRMWLKRHFWKMPGRYLILFLYHLLVLGAWKAGRVGWIWARLRTEVYRLVGIQALRDGQVGPCAGEDSGASGCSRCSGQAGGLGSAAVNGSFMANFI